MREYLRSEGLAQAREMLATVKIILACEVFLLVLWRLAEFAATGS